MSGEEESIEVDSDWEQALSTASSLGSSKVFACSVEGCPKFFSKQKRLKVHMLCHTGERPYVCSEENCLAAYTRRSHLQRHIDNVHLQRRFACDICPSSFFSNEALKKHHKVAHSSEKEREKCDICGKTFTKKSHLRSHVASHSGELPHKCDTCGQGFKYPNKLRHHMASKHQMRKCSDCDQEFENFHALRKHKAQEHAQVFKCDTCGFKFKHKCRYYNHLQTHALTSEIFQCPIKNCDLSYSTFSNLKNHLKIIHDGVRFNCNVSGCSKVFMSRRALAAHLRSHSKEPKESTVASSNKTPKTRKDKGKPKKAMATFLSNVEIGVEGEKILLKDHTSKIQREEIEQELKVNPDLVRDMNEQTDQREEEANSKICLREFSNELKKKAAKERANSKWAGTALKKLMPKALSSVNCKM